MAEWAYRASEKKRSLETTRKLADELGFLARSAHRKDRTRVPFAHEIRVGDIIHFYYRSKREGVITLGSYRVLGASDPPRFRPALGEGSALTRIEDVSANRALLEQLQPGHKRDPELGAFTGLRIDRVHEATVPAFEVWSFPQQGTLTRTRRDVAEPLLSRITRDPRVMAGRPCIRGLRVTVGTVLGLLAAGRSEQEILEEYPYLEPLDMRAALAYAAYRMEEREVPLEAA